MRFSAGEFSEDLSLKSVEERGKATAGSSTPLRFDQNDAVGVGHPGMVAQPAL
jgi:hypothetical protein